MKQLTSNSLNPLSILHDIYAIGSDVNFCLALLFPTPDAAIFIQNRFNIAGSVD